MSNEQFAVIRIRADGTQEVVSDARTISQALAAMGKSGEASGKQIAAAMRGVPAQMTDIFASLASGQQPLTVLIQQGGQLKDMFGGIGPAAKAIGGYVAGLVSPFTIAAAAAGALGYAMYQGAEESRALAKSLVLTGNAAGTSISQLNEAARSVSESTRASQGAVAGALVQVVEAGHVAAQSIGLVAEAAVRMERAAGKPIEKTVEEFAELGKAPVEASTKLNEKYNYLTQSIYQQIKALEDQGRTLDAAKLAQETYAKALNERSEEIRQNIGTIQQAWLGLKDVAGSAWDAMLGTGREDLNAKLNRALATMQGKGFLEGGLAFGGKDEALAIIRTAEARLAVEKQTGEEKAKQNKATIAQIEWDKQGVQFADKRRQMENEIAKARQAAADASISDKELTARIAKIREKYAEDGSKNDLQQQIQARLSLLKDAAKQELDIIRERVKAGELTEIQGIEETLAIQLTAYREQYEAQQKLLGATKDQGDRAKVMADMQKTVVEWANVETKAVLEVAAVREKANAAAIKQQDEYLARVYEETATLKEKAKAAEYENASIGLTADQLAVLTARRYDEQIALKQEKLAAIEMIDVNAAEADSIREQIAALEGLKRAEMVRPKLQEQAREWENFTRDIERSLTDSLMRSFEKGGKDGGEQLVDSIRNTLKTAAFKVIVQAIVSPVMNGVGSMFGMGGGAPGMLGGGSGMGGLGNLFSLGNNIFGGGGSTFSSLYNSFATSSFGQTLGLSSLGGMAALGGLGGGISIGATGALGTGIAGGLGTGITAGGGLGLGMSGSIGGIGAMEGLGGLGAGISSAGAGGATLTGFGSALGTALPWIGGALAVGSLLGGDLFGGGGGPKYGGTRTYGLDGTVNTTRNEDQAGLFSAMDQLATQFKGIAKGLHLPKDAQLYLDYEQNPQGKGAGNATLAFWSPTMGIQKAFDSGFYNVAKIAKDNPQEAVAKWSEWLADVLDKVVDAANLDPSTKQLIDTFKSVGMGLSDILGNLKGLESFRDTLDHINKTAFAALPTLSDLAGNFQTLQGELGSYYQNYFTEEERRAQQLAYLTDQFSDMSLQLPKTREQFRALVESLDLNTVAGQDAFVQLMGMSDAFASITETADKAKAALDNLSTDRFKTKQDYLFAKLTGILPDYAGGGRLWGGADASPYQVPNLPPAVDRIFTPPPPVAAAASSAGTESGWAQLAKAISAMRDDQRVANAEIVRVSKITAKVLDRWDADGMPEARVLA